MVTLMISVRCVCGCKFWMTVCTDVLCWSDCTGTLDPASYESMCKSISSGSMHFRHHLYMF
jgi:hypothetical protein